MATGQENRHPFIAGALTGAAEISITYPLQYLKTLQQISDISPSTGASPSATAAGASKFTGSSAKPGAVRAPGMMDYARQTWTSFGWRGFYRGLSSNLVFALPRSAIRFTTYEKCVYRLKEKTAIAEHNASGAAGRLGMLRLTPAEINARQISYVQTFVAGTISGLVEAAACVVPMTTIEVKMVHDLNSPNPRYGGFNGAVKTIMREEGIRGIYQGTLPTMLKVGMNLGCRFLFYEQLLLELDKAWLRFLGSSGESYRFTVNSMLAGSLAGAITVFANQPVDVVKSNMQSLHASRYSSSVDCFNKILAAQGWRGLYRGTVPRLLRVMAETSLSFTFFSHFSRACNIFIDGRP